MRVAAVVGAVAALAVLVVSQYRIAYGNLRVTMGSE
jgi:hypothetical protein